ncbi:MAG: hypothetical protein C3F02_04365 [Parcubacteria group bacterium]|nr:MAG: hypothetical protein C3F02_04365 [Parcubacteria group bacterium]
MGEVSQKQLEANRENAKLGGVKTEEGKEVSRYNAIKHGLLSKEVLLSDEDEKNLEELGKRLRAELMPTGEVEVLLVDRIIANVWRLRRLLEVERETMEWQKENCLSDTLTSCYTTPKQIERRAVSNMIVNNDTETLLRYETAIERSIYKALHELQRIQSARAGGRPPAPIAIDVNISKD